MKTRQTKNETSSAGERIFLIPITLLTFFAMVAFAANSLLTRLAFQTTAIDASSFTAIRIVSGAITLLAILVLQRTPLKLDRSGWWPAVLLFTYAVSFSFAYRDISTAAGALVLFASAQLLMIGYGYFKGERTSILGMLLALVGLAAFLTPSAWARRPSSARLERLPWSPR